MTITEGDLFAEILAAYAVEQYDPAVHLLAETAAAAWKISPRSAADRLDKDDRLERVKVMRETGRQVTAYKRKSPA